MASADTLSRGNAPTRPRKQPTKVEVLEKDDTELRLEKALFGDEAGFLDSLTAGRSDADNSLQLYGGGDRIHSDAEEAEDLADVPDEDVCPLSYHRYH